MMEMIKESTFVYKDKGQHTVVGTSKIENGSKFIIGGKLSRVELVVHQHFNWLQKLMWKVCFGVVIEDYSED